MRRNQCRIVYDTFLLFYTFHETGSFLLNRRSILTSRVSLSNDKSRVFTLERNDAETHDTDETGFIGPEV